MKLQQFDERISKAKQILTDLEGEKIAYIKDRIEIPCYKGCYNFVKYLDPYQTCWDSDSSGYCVNPGISYDCPKCGARNYADPKKQEEIFTILKPFSSVRY